MALSVGRGGCRRELRRPASDSRSKASAEPARWRRAMRARTTPRMPSNFGSRPTPALCGAPRAATARPYRTCQPHRFRPAADGARRGAVAVAATQAHSRGRRPGSGRPATSQRRRGTVKRNASKFRQRYDALAARLNRAIEAHAAAIRSAGSAAHQACRWGRCGAGLPGTLAAPRNASNERTAYGVRCSLRAGCTGLSKPCSRPNGRLATTVQEARSWRCPAQSGENRRRPRRDLCRAALAAAARHVVRASALRRSARSPDPHSGGSRRASSAAPAAAAGSCPRLLRPRCRARPTA